MPPMNHERTITYLTPRHNTLSSTRMTWSPTVTRFLLLAAAVENFSDQMEVKILTACQDSNLIICVVYKHATGSYSCGVMSHSSYGLWKKCQKVVFWRQKTRRFRPGSTVCQRGGKVEGKGQSWKKEDAYIDHSGFSTAYGIPHRPPEFCSCFVNCLRGTNHLLGRYSLQVAVGSDFSHPWTNLNY